MFRRFLMVAVVSISALLLHVQNANASADGAKNYIQNLGNQVLAVVQSKQAQSAKNAKLESIFRSSVDLDWVGKFVTGRFWKQATDVQKSRYLSEYKKFILAHYTARFNEYTGGGFTITGAREEGENEYTVSMTIGAKDKPVAVDYRLRGAGGFKIIDLNIEGVSMITTQRAEFTSVISSNGFDYLIDELARKTAAIKKTGNADAS